MPLVSSVPLVPLVSSVPLVPKWRHEASLVPRVLVLQVLLGLLTIEALGKAGVGTQGGRGACMAGRLRRVLRASGACAWRVRRGLHWRVLGASGSVIAGAGRRTGGARWQAAASRLTCAVTSDILRFQKRFF